MRRKSAPGISVWKSWKSSHQEISFDARKQQQQHKQCSSGSGFAGSSVRMEKQTWIWCDANQQSGFRFGIPESQTTERSVARNTTQIINEMVLQCEFCWKECVSGRADLYGSIVMALIQVLNRNWKKKLRLQSVDWLKPPVQRLDRCKL